MLLLRQMNVRGNMTKEYCNRMAAHRGNAAAPVKAKGAPGWQAASFPGLPSIL
jgi:hypothetical protein